MDTSFADVVRGWEGSTGVGSGAPPQAPAPAPLAQPLGPGEGQVRTTRDNLRRLIEHLPKKSTHQSGMQVRLAGSSRGRTTPGPRRLPAASNWELAKGSGPRRGWEVLFWGPPQDACPIELLDLLRRVDSQVATLLSDARIFREGSGHSTHFRFSGISPETAASLQQLHQRTNSRLRFANGAHRLQVLFNNRSLTPSADQQPPQQEATILHNAFAALQLVGEEIPVSPPAAHRQNPAPHCSGRKKITSARRHHAGSISLQVASLNVRGGLANCDKQAGLMSFLDSLPTSDRPTLLAVQEHGEHEGGRQIPAELGETYTYLGRPQPRGSKHGGGAAWYVHKAVCNAVQIVDQKMFQLTYPQAQWISLAGSSGIKDIYLASVYMPTASTRMDELRAAWSQLEADILKMQAKGEVILLGDFNARVGSAAAPGELIGHHGEPSSAGHVPNATGRLMHGFLAKTQLATLGNRDPSLPTQFTWHQPTRNLQSVIDYILMDSRFASSSSLPHLIVTMPPPDLTDHCLLHTTLERRAFRMTGVKAPLTVRWKLEAFDLEESGLAYQEEVAKNAYIF